MGRRLPWHPALLTASFVAFNYVDTGVHIAATGRAMLVAVAGTLAVQALLTLVLRSRHRGAIAATVVVGLVIFWVPILEIWKAYVRLPVVQIALLAGLVMALVAYIGWLLRRGSLRPAASVTSDRLNAVAGILAIIVVAGFPLSRQAAIVTADLGIERGVVGRANATDGSGPDIFVILADGHPRPDSLLEQTGHDLSGFIGEMEALGFEHATESRSNYRWTQASLMTTLYMRPLEQVSPEVARARLPTPDARRLLRDNEAFATLREHGYTITAIGPPFEHAALRSADRFVDASYLNSFECHLIRRTLVGHAAWAISPALIGDPRRDAVVRSLDEVRRIAAASDPSPTFTFVHLPVPHKPILWDRAGAPVDDEEGSDCAPQGAAGLSAEGLIDAHVESLIHADRLIVDAVADILRSSDEPPVILVISDHGAHLVGSSPDNADPVHWRDSFANLVLAYTPGTASVLPDDVSLVNVLPRIFNAYLGTDLPTWPDTSFNEGGGAAPEP